MHKLEELKEKLVEKLESYKDKEMSGSNLEMVDTLAHAIKNICKIIEDKQEYSERSYRGRSYRGDMSYRDNRRSYDDYADRRYSRDEGMVDELTDLMHSAPEHMKADFRKLIQKIETM